MRVLFFDTETNGLPQNRHAPPSMTQAWPHIVQIAWELWDLSEEGLKGPERKANLLIAPRRDMKWNDEAARIHGITPRLIKECGVSIDVGLRWFMEDVRTAQYIVCHNLAFDRNVVLAESHRLGIDPADWWPAHPDATICTMLGTKAFCAIPSPRGTPADPYKWPRLQELWEHLGRPGGEEPTWHSFQTERVQVSVPVERKWHDAADDVACLVACFKELRRRGKLPVRAVTPPRVPLVVSPQAAQASTRSQAPSRRCIQ